MNEHTPPEHSDSPFVVAHREFLAAWIFAWGLAIGGVVEYVTRVQWWVIVLAAATTIALGIAKIVLVVVRDHRS